MRKAAYPVLLGIAAMLAAAFAEPVFAERVLPQTREQVQLSFAPIVRGTAPAVVNIYSRRVVQSRMSPLFDDPLFRQFFGLNAPSGAPRQRIESSLGSGVVVAADGTIVTNHHVIAGADEVTIVFADRREFEARVLGSDERTDLAVLKVDAGEPLPFIQFADSDAIEVGDLVLAIGNPFGVGQTVTSGIVSAQAQTRVGISDINFFIQTDAAINPGNSGGALVGMDGQLVGINTAIYSRSGGSLGIGFAVPSNMVRSVVAAFTGGGRIQRPWLGAVGREVTSDVAHALGLRRPAGVLIEEVHPRSPADEAGIRVGDVMLEMNGRPVDDSQSLRYRLATAQMGGTAEVTIWRRGEELMVSVPIRIPPEDPPRAERELKGSHPLAGASVANASPALAEELGEDRFQPGVVVLSIRPNSAAQRIGLRPGDRVLEVNGEEVSTTAGVERLMGKRAKRWQILLGRGDQRFNLVVDS